MGKGTPAMGRKAKRNHLMCPRCGHMSFHKQKRACSACAFPEAKKRNHGSLKAYRRLSGKRPHIKAELKKSKSGHKRHPLLQNL